MEKDGSFVHPLIQLMQRISASKQPLTKEERMSLQRCQQRMNRRFTEGFIAAGAAACAALLGSGRNFWERTFVALGTAGISGFITLRRSSLSCISEIVALDGTRLQEEMLTILKTEQAFDPSFGNILNRFYFSETVYIDSNQDRPVLRFRKRFVPGEAELSSESPIQDWSTQDKNIQESFNQSKVFDEHLNPQNMDVAASLCDPFDLFSWNGAEEEEEKKKKTAMIKKQSSGRLNQTDAERRQYRRNQYMEWKRKQERLNTEVGASDSGVSTSVLTL